MSYAIRAPGKVNLCLFLGPLREDGRHELATLLESVSLADELTVSVAADPPDVVRCRGLEESNLVSVALERLRARGWEGPPLTVEIAKRVPVAGGMGGGSADAAAVLRLANDLRPVSDHALAELAAELGADVPSQLAPGLVLGTGAGERVAHQPPLAPHAFVILPQPYRLLTREVYVEADRLGLARDRAELEHKLRELQGAVCAGARLAPALLVNDLEQAALSLVPEIGDALRAVGAAGPDQALVSGSGPTVLGLFWGQDGNERARRAAATLRARFPAVDVAVPVEADFARVRRVAGP